MLGYYYKLKNGDVKGQGGSSGNDAMTDEVAEDTSAHAAFMTQNNVSNVVNTNIAQMQGDVASTSFSV